MNSKVVAGILAIVAIVLAGVVFYQQNQLNEARREIARLAEEKTLAEKAAAEAQKEAELAALTCCAGWKYAGPTRFGARTSPTYRCGGDSCIWWQSWTGTAAMCSPGSYPTPWM